MRLIQLLTLIVSCAATATAWSGEKAGQAPPLDLKGKALQQVFEGLLPGMGDKDVNARKGPQQQWQTICFQAGAPGRETLRADACKLMADRLGSQTPNPVRVFLLGQLAFLGRGECVAKMAAALDDPDLRVRDAAVRCLANNPAPEATAALVQKLPAARAAARVALVNALGFRADRAAVDALAKVLGRDDPAAGAAARALGRVGTPEVARALAEARKQAAGPARLAMDDAYLLCADRRLKEGRADEAAAIYQELYRAGGPRPVRLAALQGVLKAAGDGAGTLILQEVAGTDADARAVALGQIASASPGALKALAAGLDKLSPSGQVQVLGALAARGDRSHRPAALAAVKSQDGGVRRAGLLALGKLGDASTAPVLLEALYADPKLADAAREGLANLSGEGVDESLVAALKAEKDARKRGPLINVLESRKSAAAVPVLLEGTSDPDTDVRVSALAALRQLAEPAHLPALLRALLQAEKGRERDEAERTVLAVCARVPGPERQAEPLLTAFAGGSEADQAVLLPLLGRVGGTRALEIVRGAVASDDPRRHALGVQALCNWPDPSASADLLQVAQGDPDAPQRLRALQGLIRVNAVKNAPPGDRSNLTRLAVLKKAMDLSARDEERRQVLDALAAVKDIETLRYVLPFLDHETLGQRACRTVVELAHSQTLREPNRPAFEQALDRVIAICRDPDLVDRAKKYRQGL